MSFWEIRILPAPETSEGLTNFLWEQGALGVVEEELAGQPPLLRAFFSASVSSADLAGAVGGYQEALAALGFDTPPAPAEIAPLVEEAWASAWQRAFPPREVGERLIVLPPWEASAGAAGSRAPVVIHPGRAFGTGQHGSTEGCLALLEQAVAARGPDSVLDVGTGTGILAVAAVKLGAARVFAIDVDPDAVEAARHNAERNGCADRIRVGLGGPDALPDAAVFDLVLANLLTQAHLALAPRYARLVAAGGALVLGGMLPGEDLQVTAALGQLAFAVETSLEIDGWASVLLRREP